MYLSPTIFFYIEIILYNHQSQGYGDIYEGGMLRDATYRKSDSLILRRLRLRNQKPLY